MAWDDKKNLGKIPPAEFPKVSFGSAERPLGEWPMDRDGMAHAVTIYYVDPRFPHIDAKAGSDVIRCIDVDLDNPNFLVLLTQHSDDHGMIRAIRWDRISSFEIESWQVDKDT
jgi:hypothetical protein